MEKGRVHKYTCFQIVFFLGVFVVMNIKTISIAFPFMTFLCIPTRLFFLPRFFQGWELLLLDGEEERIEEWIQAKNDSIRGFSFRKAESVSDPDEETPMAVANDADDAAMAEDVSL
jgi:hypothetical protein